MSDKLAYIFDPKIKPIDRIKLWEKEYLRVGLELCEWNISIASKYLAFSERKIMIILNNYPDLKNEYNLNQDNLFNYKNFEDKRWKEKIYKAEVEKRLNTFWFKQCSEEEKKEIIERIKRQYL